MLFKTNLRSGSVDASDLRNDTLLQWQHTWYMFLAAFFGYLLPTLVPGIGWGDWLGGFCFSGMLRLTIAHHVSQASDILFSSVTSTSITEYVLHKLHSSLSWFYALR